MPRLPGSRDTIERLAGPAYGPGFDTRVRQFSFPLNIHSSMRDQATQSALAGLALVLCGACASRSPAAYGTDAEPSFAPRAEVVEVVATDCSKPISPEPIQLERISSAVPWPRGMVFLDGELLVLARGRHRSAGGCDPAVEDHSGSLFAVNRDVAEQVVRGTIASEPVQQNARLFVEPDADVFRVWDRDVPPLESPHMDRPYCTLAFDPTSRNLFVCGFSGVDLPERQFRKNATDSIHRYDLRTGRWYPVEMHDASVVPADELGYTVPNQYYPHHDPETNAAPHGFVNGPDGCEAVGQFLYSAGKDNHVLVQYDLAGIQADPDAGPPESRIVFREWLDVRAKDSSGSGETRRIRAMGPSALAAHDGYLYVGFRTSSFVVRFPLETNGDVKQPLVGEAVAQFEPYDADKRHSADLMDLAFNSKGELFVACASSGRVWKIGVPDPDRVFDGRDDLGTKNQPFVDLRALTDNPKAKCGNIVFDEQDHLYICSGNYDSGTRIAGVQHFHE